jgi:orotidine-5'-phosphate decarboxylase
VTQHFADRLAAALRAKGNAVCVGLDPRWELLPLEVRTRHGGETLEAVAGAYEEFCSRVLDVVAPLVPVVKPQSAFFEACGPPGLAALQRLIRKARQQGLLVILDGKRNDIASSAAAYAEAALGGVSVAESRHSVWDADALTVNPYLGRDAVEPFLQSARRSGRGVFVLVRTSNAGAGQFQDLDCGGRPLFQHVGEAVGQWARENLGQCGYGDVGAVVGATYPAELQLLRRLLPDVFFLIPGFGVQGASAADTAPAFRADGLGAVVNSSRAILYSVSPAETAWEAAVESATRATVAALTAHTLMARLCGVPRCPSGA